MWEIGTITNIVLYTIVYVNMVNKEVDAKTAEETVYVNMVNKEVDAKTAEEIVYANMVNKEVNADYVHTASIKREEWTVQFVI